MVDDSHFRWDDLLCLCLQFAGLAGFIFEAGDVVELVYVDSVRPVALVDVLRKGLEGEADPGSIFFWSCTSFCCRNVVLEVLWRALFDLLIPLII